MDIIQKRNRLYRGTLIATAIFSVASGALMVGFKSFEGYFDSHGRMAVVAEEAWAGQESMSVVKKQKKNFPVTILDEPNGKLEVTIAAKIPENYISVNEEFPQNKLVITLQDGISYMKEGAVLVSDSSWTEAVGAYKNDGDIVIEVYCEKACDYQAVYKNGKLTISFTPLRDNYRDVVVLYTPWDNRNSFLLKEWKQKIEKLEEMHHIKVFSTLVLREEYNPEDVVSFANYVHADAMIGIELVDSVKEDTVTVCDSEYFIPEFGNGELALLQEQEFAEKTGLKPSGYKQCDAAYQWMKKSEVPTALTQFNTMLDKNNVEKTYALNQNMMEAFDSIIKEISDTYWEDVEE